MRLFTELLKKERQLFVEIRGRECVLAEGYCRIDSYSDDRIILVSEQGRVMVYGEGLVIRHLSAERTAVEGRIDRVEFI